MLTYKQADDLVIDAYFKDEIKPLDPYFCFCGTLSGNSVWTLRDTKQVNYSYEEYGHIEKAFFEGMDKDIRWNHNGSVFCNRPITENQLFNGMCAALDVLKEIHRSRGENVDELPVLKKRELYNNVESTSK